MQPVVTGTVPAARGVHTCTTVGEYLVLYGGSSEFDSETLQCQEYYGDIHYIHKGESENAGLSKVQWKVQRLLIHIPHPVAIVGPRNTPFVPS